MSCDCIACRERVREDEEDLQRMRLIVSKKNTWPCLGKPEDLKEQPIGMYHCEFCGEMQIAGVPHLLPQFPSQWAEPFPKLEEPEPSGMVSYPTSLARMESVLPIGPPHARPALVPPSSLPMSGTHPASVEEKNAQPTPSTCPSCEALESVTFTREDESFTYGIGIDAVSLRTVVDKGRCSACSFEFTDWRAEKACDNAVQAHLQASNKEQP
jgi:hypothetical protein